jgi:WD40 repeat protein
VNSISSSYGGAILCAAYSTKSLKIFDLRAKNNMHEILLHGHDDIIRSVHINKEGTLVICSSYD